MTHVGILVEDYVAEEELGQDRLREVLDSLADKLGVADHVQISEQSGVSEDEDDVEVEEFGVAVIQNLLVNVCNDCRNENQSEVNL